MLHRHSQDLRSQSAQGGEFTNLRFPPRAFCHLHCYHLLQLTACCAGLHARPQPPRQPADMSSVRKHIACTCKSTDLLEYSRLLSLSTLPSQLRERAAGCGSRAAALQRCRSRCTRWWRTAVRPGRQCSTRQAGDGRLLPTGRAQPVPRRLGVLRRAESPAQSRRRRRHRHPATDNGKVSGTAAACHPTTH